MPGRPPSAAPCGRGPTPDGAAHVEASPRDGSTRRPGGPGPGHGRRVGRVGRHGCVPGLVFGIPGRLTVHREPDLDRPVVVGAPPRTAARPGDRGVPRGVAPSGPEWHLGILVRRRAALHPGGGGGTGPAARHPPRLRALAFPGTGGRPPGDRRRRFDAHARLGMRARRPEGLDGGGRRADHRRSPTALRTYGGPVLLRWCWEMNLVRSHTEVGGPSGFIGAWTRIRSIFARVGADNASFVWCPALTGADPTPYLPGATPRWTGSGSTATTATAPRPSPRCSPRSTASGRDRGGRWWSPRPARPGPPSRDSSPVSAADMPAAAGIQGGGLLRCDRSGGLLAVHPGRAPCLRALARDPYFAAA